MNRLLVMSETELYAEMHKVEKVMMNPEVGWQHRNDQRKYLGRIHKELNKRMRNNEEQTITTRTG